MAILPGAGELNLKKALEDPASGPRPLTIEEYRQRTQGRHLKQQQQPQAKEVKRERGGVAVRNRRNIGELRRLEKLAVTVAEKNNFKNQRKLLEKEEKRRRQQLKKNHKDKLNDMFNTCFNIIDSIVKKK